MADPESKIAQLIEITGLTNNEAERLLKAANGVVEEAVERFFTVGSDGLRETFRPENHRSSAVYDYREDFSESDNYMDAGYGVGPETSFARSLGESSEAQPGRDRSPLVRQGRDQEPPPDLTFSGGFHEVKYCCQMKEKWLLVYVHGKESKEDPVSKSLSKKLKRKLKRQLNSLNVWTNAKIKEIVRKHFILWQAYEYSEEGKKLICWYKIDRMPAFLIIDPYTGYKMHNIEGDVDVQNMKEFLHPYMEKRPVDKFRELSDNTNTPEEVVRIEYPALPEEPARCIPGVVNMAIRLPYGDRIERKFLATDPIQVLWSLAAERVPNKEFVLICLWRGIKLNYNEKKSIQEAGVADGVLTLTYEK